MKHVSKLLDNYERVFGTVSVLLMVVAVAWQILTRYCLGAPSRWSEEMARYLMLYLSFMGIGAGIKLKKHVGIEIFENLLKDERAKSAFRLVSQIITLVIICAILYLSLTTAIRISKSTQMSPAMRIPMWIPYATIPLGFVGGVLRQVEEIAKTIRFLFNVSVAAPDKEE